MSVKGLLKYFKFSSIRKSLLAYSLLLIFIMLITSVYTFYNAHQFAARMDYMFVSNMELTELSKNVDSTDSELLNYLTTKNSDSLDNYSKYSDILRKESDKINGQVSYDKNIVMLKDIANMINDYLFEADHAISERRIGDVIQYNNMYLRTQKISKYINSYIDRLNLDQFRDNTNKYFSMSKDLRLLKILSITIIADTLMLNIILLLWFTNKISVPIITLADTADEISRGNFEVPDVKVNGDGEVKIMADAFNKMKNNIKLYIKKLQAQSEIEAKFMDEKMQNLKMKNLLKNAQLRALQSQINPHFLYNSFNAGVQLAMMEGADKTSIFLEKLSNLFRYNLRKMDKPVTLGEEINNLKTYIYILKTRFGDLYDFEFDIDETILEVNMPAMIIQPLVENSCIHGIQDMEFGGQVKLTVKNNKNFINVIIEDNGKGIPKEEIDSILNLEKTENREQDKATKSHGSGIGLKNVIMRMRVFFDEPDVVSIESEQGNGTRIILKIPYTGGEYKCIEY